VPKKTGALPAPQSGHTHCASKNRSKHFNFSKTPTFFAGSENTPGHLLAAALPASQPRHPNPAETSGTFRQSGGNFRQLYAICRQLPAKVHKVK
jgi:hypothetical protein